MPPIFQHPFVAWALALVFWGALAFVVVQFAGCTPEQTAKLQTAHELLCAPGTLEAIGSHVAAQCPPANRSEACKGLRVSYATARELCGAPE